MRDPTLFILRCACRDWPCHLPEALMSPGSTCGLCHQPAELILDPYEPKEDEE